jgi:protein-L-isoaspartate O-methyltransferase
MKHQIFFLIFIVLLKISFLYGASINTPKQFQIGLQILETISFAGSEHLLNISYAQEDLSAYIARNLLPQGLVLSIEPNEKLAEKTTLDYCGINNLHIVSMDAFFFNFQKSLDIILSIFPDDWTRNDQTITHVIRSVSQSLKSGGMLYLCLDNNNAQKCALITQKLVSSNEYEHLCYQQNDQEKFYLITAQKK